MCTCAIVYWLVRPCVCRASPLELAGCEEEAAIVCNQGHIKGQQGVALDDMVYVMTRMARQMEEVRGRSSSCWWFGLVELLLLMKRDAGRGTGRLGSHLPYV